MSVSDLTEEMIKEICALYAIDVMLLRHLNMEDKYCKGYVSDKYVSTLSWGIQNDKLGEYHKEWNEEYLADEWNKGT